MGGCLNRYHINGVSNLTYSTTTLLHGMGGTTFNFTVFCKNTSFGRVPAVYAFIRVACDYLGNTVDEVSFIGQTDDLANQQTDLQLWANLERYKANRIAVLMCPSEPERLLIVSHLVTYYRPLGNLQNEQQQPYQLKLVS